jgi:putative addiction module component (TIGR02574 family)
VTDSTRRLLEEVLKLPARERADFVGQVMESFDDPAAVDRAWKAEIVWRVRRILEANDPGLSLEQVEADVRAEAARARGRRDTA